MLIVDADVDVRRELAAELLLNGFVALAARSATEALEFRDVGVIPDALVFDIRISTTTLASFLFAAGASHPPVFALSCDDLPPEALRTNHTVHVVRGTGDVPKALTAVLSRAMPTAS